MKINQYRILSQEKDKIYTEILYGLASSMAEDTEFSVFSCECFGEDALHFVEKHLKSLKHASKIDFFIRSSELCSSTEGSYLLNKHPEITDVIAGADNLFIVKL